jgi:hypothetical protein
MGHKGPVKGLRATGPKWFEPIYYSILLYHDGLLPLILFVAAFGPSLESQNRITTAIACKQVSKRKFWK